MKTNKKTLNYNYKMMLLHQKRQYSNKRNKKTKKILVYKMAIKSKKINK